MCLRLSKSGLGRTINFKGLDIMSSPFVIGYQNISNGVCSFLAAAGVHVTVWSGLNRGQKSTISGCR